MTQYTIRLSAREDYLVGLEARRRGVRVIDVVAALAATGANALPGPDPGPAHTRPRETQTERRARLRNASPTGKSPYTEQLEQIRSNQP